MIFSVTQRLRRHDKIAPASDPNFIETSSLSDFQCLQTIGNADDDRLTDSALTYYGPCTNSFQGTGTFGCVRLCSYKTTDKFFCMKILSKKKILRLKQTKHVMNEKETLMKCRHPFIARLYKTFQDNSNL